MASTDTFIAVANENGAYTILGRLCAEDGTGSASPITTEGNLVKQADLTSITLYIYDRKTNVAVSGSPLTLTISSVVFDTLQTSGIWGNIPDGEGGNFKYTVIATLIPDAETSYGLFVKFIPSAGATYQSWGKWRIESRGVLPE